MNPTVVYRFSFLGHLIQGVQRLGELVSDGRQLARAVSLSSSGCILERVPAEPLQSDVTVELTDWHMSTRQ